MPLLLLLLLLIPLLPPIPSPDYASTPAPSPAHTSTPVSTPAHSPAPAFSSYLLRLAQSDSSQPFEGPAFDVGAGGGCLAWLHQSQMEQVL